MLSENTDPSSSADDSAHAAPAPAVLQSVSESAKNAVLAFRTADDHQFQAVVSREEPLDWMCVSTQLGCLVGCPFCATGNKTLIRNLTGPEIAGQILACVEHCEGAPLRIHFAGTGEPSHNLDGIMAAYELLADHPRAGRSAEWQVTTSVPTIEHFERLWGWDVWHTVSVSVHACSDRLRGKLVPGSVSFTALSAHLAGLPLRGRPPVFALNYLLLTGVSDDEDMLDGFLDLVRRARPSYVLLQAYANAGPKFSTSDESLSRWATRLASNEISVRIGAPSRRDSNGGCGTLRIRRHAGEATARP
jgi:23S rRNA (adenine2503-C2)-methyltransferase